MNENIHIVQDFQGLAPAFARKRTVVIADSFFRSVPLPACTKGADFIFIEASEENKTLSTVSSICSRLLELGADRDTFIVALGGGITTDIAGFVASVYKRGVPFALVPTTLLSQVDAAFGGKNGVNFEEYKNIIGCFSEPQSVWICPEFLRTLPEREFRCGLAEMLKTFIIADAQAYAAAVADYRKDLAGLIRRCIEIKCSIVAEDPKDFGVRQLLNFGHTFAHAIEKCTREYRHGEAVAIGMIMASRLAEAKGIAEKGLTERLKRDFASLSLPVEAPLDEKEMEAAILQDKKRAGGSTRFILPEKIGKVRIWDSSVTV